MRVAAIPLTIFFSVGALAVPGYADTPARGCPPPFNGPKTIQTLAEEHEDATGIPPEEVLPFLESYDMNGDNLLCNMRSPERSPFFGIAIDNVANH